MSADGPAGHFARWMALAAALVAVTVASAPPAAFHASSQARLQEVARANARQVARRLEAFAARQPRLWRYTAHRAVRSVPSRGRPHEVASVRVTDCQGRTLYATGGPSADVAGPSARAEVAGTLGVVGAVEVVADPTGDRRRLLWVGLASCVLALLLGLFVYVVPTRVVRRQATLLREGRSVVRVQEAERRRIARDLHDGLGQMLTALRLSLEAALARPDEARGRLADGLVTCDETLEEVRRVVDDLVPPDLEAGRIVEAFRACTERFEVRSGVLVSVRAALDFEPPEEVALCLLRVLQEALANAARHGDAREIGVLLQSTPRGIELVITDDGTGFDPAAPRRGTGLAGMRERCGFLGGTLEVHSSQGQGARLTARLPLG